MAGNDTSTINGRYLMVEESVLLSRIPNSVQEDGYGLPQPIDTKMYPHFFIWCQNDVYMMPGSCFTLKVGHIVPI